MMIPSPQLIKDRAARTAKQIFLSVMGALMALVGLGFLISALWIYLARLEGSLFASLAVGVIFVLLAGILFLLGKLAGRPPRVRATPRGNAYYDPRVGADPYAPPRGEYPPLLEAFIFGLNTASRMRRRRR
ncbi:phage holin family protein [Halodurantibacterium flavum]|uniref:Phage holin family protein n=1 Tax=Halodurantibacterium flavum TaxID=1382802 RepID=A0ABW4S1A5_9RHOB